MKEEEHKYSSTFLREAVYTPPKMQQVLENMMTQTLMGLQSIRGKILRKYLDIAI